MRLIDMLLRAYWFYGPNILLMLTGVVCCRKVDVLHGVLLSFALVAVLSNTKKIQSIMLNTISIFISGLILSKMTFQTRFFPHEQFGNDTCNHALKDFLLPSNPAWYGFELNVLTSFNEYFVILALTTLFYAVQVYKMSGMAHDDRIFGNISRNDLDDNITGALKFMANYGFYKFGVEVCKIAMAAVVITRNDVFGLIYGIGLLLISKLTRINLKRVWWLLQILIAYCIVHQFVMALPSFCWDLSPWFDKRIQNWLFLTHPLKSIPAGDFVLLVLVSEQKKVFREERHSNHPAGSNKEIRVDNLDTYQNPVHDHTTLSRPGIDHFKTIVFFLLYWGSLIISLTIGGTRADLLSLTYLSAGFIIIWLDADLALWKVKRLRKWWNIFMIYSLLCMILKSISTELMCLVQGSVYQSILKCISGSVCGGKPQLFMDLLAFSFLLFQRRFIESNYFLHYVNDIKATIALESCGAALFANWSREKVGRDIKHHAATVDKIKTEMAIIKENNERSKTVEPKTHDDAILTGDYFMFDDNMRPKGGLSKDGKTFFDSLIFTKQKADVVRDFKPFSFNEENTCNKARMIQWFRMLQEVLIYFVQKVIQILNDCTRDFRFIVWAMKLEKKQLKQSLTNLHEDICLVNTLKMSDFEQSEDEKDVHSIIGLLYAVWFSLLDYSELACYLSILLFQGLAPTLISLPIPLMLFLWGALTVRHPSPTFWITLIAYTEVIMVFKALSKNEIFPWNDKIHQEQLYFYSPAIIGVSDLAITDLILLVMLFIHRKKLKWCGLWSTKADEPTMTAVDFIDPASSAIYENLRKYFEAIWGFYRQLFQKSSRLPFDLYTYSFLCEFLTFVIIFFGFSSFVPQARLEDRVFYLAENEVPTSYLITLIVQFLVIIIDRILYLRRNIIGKLVMHIVLVIFSHIWLFLVLPLVTYRHYGDLLWPQLWYTVRFISFLFSAYQLRNGYPMRVQNFFLAKQHNYWSLYTFKVLKFTPFFFPLRHILGWVSTKTSLTLYEWFLMESMHAIIYETKCSRDIVSKGPSPRGEAYPKKFKLISGGLVLIGFFLLIWSPLILFAFFKSVALPDPPIQVSFSLQINNYPILYSAELREDEILPLTEQEFQYLQAMERGDPVSFSSLEQYDHSDVVIIQLSRVSRVTWNVSPPTIAQIKEDAINNKKFTMYLHLVLHQRENGIPLQSSIGEFFFPLDSATKEGFIKILDSQNENVFQIIQELPHYFESKKGIINAISSTKGLVTYTNVSLLMNSSGDDRWWELVESCTIQKLRLNEVMEDDCGRFIFYVFSGKRIPGFFQYFTTKGIIGIYASVVIVIWGLIRTATSEMFLYVRYYTLPNVDAIYQLCNDIYLVRESGQFDLEEDLFAKLLFLFRSPETMIKYTKKKN